MLYIPITNLSELFQQPRAKPRVRNEKISKNSIAGETGVSSE